MISPLRTLLTCTLLSLSLAGLSALDINRESAKASSYESTGRENMRTAMALVEDTDWPEYSYKTVEEAQGWLSRFEEFSRRTNQARSLFDDAGQAYYNAYVVHSNISNSFGWGSENYSIARRNADTMKRNSDRAYKNAEVARDRGVDMSRHIRDLKRFIQDKKEQAAAETAKNEISTEVISRNSERQQDSYRYFRTVALTNNGREARIVRVSLWAGYYQDCIASPSHFVRQREYRQEVVLASGETKAVEFVTDFMPGKIADDRCTGISDVTWEVVR